MTDISREILEKHQIRKTKEQKAAFRGLALSTAKENGYSAKVETNGSAENIVIGDVDHAKVIYTAHYDTPAGTPFPNLMIPKNKLLYVLYQIAICLLLYSIPILIMTVGSGYVYSLTDSVELKNTVLWLGYLLIWVILALLLFGPANKHNANDNTSGVTVILDLMAAMPIEERSNVAFVLFDLEERGCLGSAQFNKAHKSKLKSTPVINFDCVGVGSTILLAPRKGARSLAPKLGEAFTANDTFATEIALNSTFSNSDHKNFSQGVGVASFTTSKHGVLYTGKIHTKHDTECNEENIDFIVECAIKLAKII